jgi:hypothetical protein
LCSFFGLVNAREVIEVKSFHLQPDETHLAFTLGIERHQNAAILSQNMIYTAHIAGFISVQPIVMGNTTGIGTKGTRELLS